MHARQAEAAVQEAALVHYAERLSRFRQGRRAVHLHLSKLQPYNRREHHLRIAVRIFEEMVGLFEGQTVALANGDIVCVANGATPAALEDAVLRVRHLFENDPLLGESHGPVDRFFSMYELGSDYDRFLRDMRALHEAEKRRQQRLGAISGADDPESLPPLDGHRLSELIAAIARADLSNLMRRQSVCMLLPGATPRPIFRELFISISDLRDTVTPGHDISADPWLFQYLTRTLDRRMLSLLRRNDDSATSNAFSFNVNVVSLLSPEFLAFDAELRIARGRIVLELQYTDIMSDVEAYLFARDFVKARNYRLCLDGVTAPMLPFVDRDRLGVDLIKIVWSDRMREALAAEALEEYRAAVERFDRARTILCRCDDGEAIRFGQATGITMFQGRGVERLLTAGVSPPPGGAGLTRPSAAMTS